MYILCGLLNKHVTLILPFWGISTSSRLNNGDRGFDSACGRYFVFMFFPTSLKLLIFYERKNFANTDKICPQINNDCFFSWF